MGGVPPSHQNGNSENADAGEERDAINPTVNFVPGAPVGVRPSSDDHREPTVLPDDGHSGQKKTETVCPAEGTEPVSMAGGGQEWKSPAQTSGGA